MLCTQEVLSVTTFKKMKHTKAKKIIFRTLFPESIEKCSKTLH